TELPEKSPYKISLTVTHTACEMSYILSRCGTSAAKLGMPFKMKGTHKGNIPSFLASLRNVLKLSEAMLSADVKTLPPNNPWLKKIIIIISITPRNTGVWYFPGIKSIVKLRCGSLFNVADL